MAAEDKAKKQAMERDRCTGTGDRKAGAKRPAAGPDLRLLVPECPSAAQRLVPGLH